MRRLRCAKSNRTKITTLIRLYTVIFCGSCYVTAELKCKQARKCSSNLDIVKITIAICEAVVNVSANLRCRRHEFVEQEEVHEGTLSVAPAELVIGLFDI